MPEHHERQLFFGMQVLLGDQWHSDQAVIVEGDIVKAIIPANMIKHHLPATQHKFPKDYYLIPGLIDLHVHGANGRDVMDANIASLNVMTDALASEGVTGFLATTMTAPDDKIEAAIATAVKFRSTEKGDALLGLHLEGPFISPERMGAQHGEYVKEPDLELFKHWQKIAEHHIKLVTIAPELPGAIGFIKALRNQSLVLSIGHTNATYDEACEGVEAGCTHATHLFNAMRGLHQREPGAVTALMMAHSVNAEMIVDGVHLHPAIVELIYKMKGKDRLLLVSDAMRAKCMGDGQFELGGQQVVVKDGRATLADGTIAGSTLRLPDAIKNMAAFSGCSLAEAVHMASFNPAQVLGITQHKGSIDVGKDADFVILDANFNVRRTMRMGELVYSAK